MLAGGRAFGGRSAIETMAAILSGPPAPIQEARPDVPPALAAIVDRCLARWPSDRYKSTADLARDLRSLRDPSTSGVSVQTPLRPRRRLGPLAVAGLLAAVAIGVAGVATWPQWAGAVPGS